MQTRPFSLKDYPFAKSNELVLQSLVPERPSTRYWRLGGKVVAGFAIGLVLAQRHQPAWVTVSVMINIVIALILVENWLKARKTFATIDRSPTLSGLPQVELTDEGLHLVGHQGESLTRWGGLRALIPGPDGWIILLSGNGYIPLPTTAFASPAEMNAFLTALRARIPVTKEPF